MTILPKQKRQGAALLGVGLSWLLLGAWSAHAQILLTNVEVVNVTPSSFSVVGTVAPALAFPTNVTFFIFADAGGTSNLAGQVGIELYPINTGDPTATNAYQGLLSQAALKQDSMNSGHIYARVSYCAPGTTYYYRIAVTETNGQSAFWPASGPLPSATTAVENDFVVQSLQLVLTLPASDPAGSIVILSSSNTPSLLAGVSGDGVASNEVYFSLSDLLAAGGQTNYLPLGSQTFTARVLGASSNSAPQNYSLNFTSNFLVGEAEQLVYGRVLTLSLGSNVLQAGQSGSLPISLNTVGVSNLSFVLNFPTNRFSSLTLQALSPQLGSASLQVLGSNSLELSFSPAAGQMLQGNQQLAQLNFTTVSNQSSTFVSLSPQSVQAVNADGSTANLIIVQRGRLAIIGLEPLLDSLITSGGARQLALYGIPGDSYQIQSSTKMGSPGNWTNFERVPLTNQVEILSGLNKSAAVIFYRAYEFTTLQPILDPEPSVGGLDSLVLYGMPWSAYEVEYATNVGSTNWILLSRIALTNSFQMVTGLSTKIPAIYYRCILLNADPPILVPQLAGQNRSLLVYGLAGTNYGLQYATNLSGVVTWYPLLSYRLTNAFQTISNLGSTNPAMFYRLQKQ